MASQAIVVRFSNTVEDWRSLQALPPLGLRLWWRVWPIVVIVVSLALPFWMLLSSGHTTIAYSVGVMVALFTLLRLLPLRKQPTPRFLLPRTCVFSDRGMHYELAGEVGELRWLAYRDIIERPDFVAFELYAANYMIVPRRAFENESDFAAFGAFVRQCKTDSFAQVATSAGVDPAPLNQIGGPSVTYRNTAAQLSFVRFTGFGKARFSVWNVVLVVAMSIGFLFFAAIFYLQGGKAAVFAAWCAALSMFFIVHLIKLYAWMRWIDRGQLRRLTVTLSPSGLGIDGELGWSRSAWSLFQSFLEGPSFFGIMTKERTVPIVIPKAAFASPHEARAFRDYAISLISAGNAPPILAAVAEPLPAAIESTNPYQSPQTR